MTAAMLSHSGLLGEQWIKVGGAVGMVGGGSGFSLGWPSPVDMAGLLARSLGHLHTMAVLFIYTDAPISW